MNKLIEFFGRLIGRMNNPISDRKIKAADYRAAESVLERGDVILVRRDWEISNAFIEGYYSHGGIYAGDGMVVEAVTHDGVRVSDLIDFMMQRDTVTIVRPSFATREQAAQAAAWAVAQVGKEYDFAFKPTLERFYCFELCGVAYLQTIGPACPWMPRFQFGQLTYTGDDYILAKSKWIEIATYGKIRPVDNL